GRGGAGRPAGAALRPRWSRSRATAARGVAGGAAVRTRSHRAAQRRRTHPRCGRPSGLTAPATRPTRRDQRELSKNSLSAARRARRGRRGSAGRVRRTPQNPRYAGNSVRNRGGEQRSRPVPAAATLVMLPTTSWDFEVVRRGVGFAFVGRRGYGRRRWLI